MSRQHNHHNHTFIIYDSPISLPWTLFLCHHHLDPSNTYLYNHNNHNNHRLLQRTWQFILLFVKHLRIFGVFMAWATVMLLWDIPPVAWRTDRLDSAGGTVSTSTLWYHGWKELRRTQTGGLGYNF